MKSLLKISIALVCSASMMVFALSAQRQTVGSPDPAPAGFDNQTNGLVSQATFDHDLEVFAEQEEADEGLGPVFNAAGCADCHASPVIGGSSQITEVRAGKTENGKFIEHPGGSLIHDRAIHPNIQEQVFEEYDVRTTRLSPSVLGAGFVEAISDRTLENIASEQPPSMRGYIVRVPVLEANGALRIGRFGWKNQHASLVSFSGDAYLNEMGITSPLQPTENTSNGSSIARFDNVADPEDDGADVRVFAEFMRATKAPPRDHSGGAGEQSGERIFNQIGCVTCHVSSIVTAPVGTTINGGAFTVPPALGDKVIHPFGDFLLHDIGTGDGIVQNGGPETQNRVRTAPLWGLRTRTRLMHDGDSYNAYDAIQRHRNEAQPTRDRFRALSSREQEDLLTFLKSL